MIMQLVSPNRSVYPSGLARLTVPAPSAPPPPPWFSTTKFSPIDAPTFAAHCLATTSTTPPGTHKAPPA